MSWDDGNHAKVKKVQITYDDVIYSIQVTCAGTALQSQRRGSVGPKSAEVFMDFIKRIIKKLVGLSHFLRTASSSSFVNAESWTVRGPQKQIAGFLGTCGSVLNSIDVHYAPIPTGTGNSRSGTGSGAQKLEAQGGTGGTAWDDCWGHFGATAVSKALIRRGYDDKLKRVVHAKHHEKGTSVGSLSTSRSRLCQHSDKQSVFNFYTKTQRWLRVFKSHHERCIRHGFTCISVGTSVTSHNVSQRHHSLTNTQANNLLGTHDLNTRLRVGNSSVNVYFRHDINTIFGSNNDGSDHNGVTMIYVRNGGQGVQYVKFEYVKAGQPKQGALHGGQGGRGSSQEIVINHPDEHLIFVEGWYDSSNVILGIQFKTNQKTSEYIGYDFDGSGTKFTLQAQDKKIRVSRFCQQPSQFHRSLFRSVILHHRPSYGSPEEA
ncbi:unnamed protein product [Brassica oleracea]